MPPPAVLGPAGLRAPPPPNRSFVAQGADQRLSAQVRLPCFVGAGTFEAWYGRGPVVLAIVLVVLSAAGLGALAGALSVGSAARLGAIVRWLRHGRGGRPLRALADAPEGDVEIEGILRAEPGGVVLATAVPPAGTRHGRRPPPHGERPPEPVSAAADEVWIHTADGQALVAAEAFVRCGSLEIAPGQPAASLPADLGELPADLVSIGRWPVRCLRSGDRVRATGRLERAPDLEGPGGYRTRTVRYRLRAPALPASPGASEDVRRAPGPGGSGSSTTACILVAGTRLPRLLVARRARAVAAGLGGAAALLVSLAGLALIPLPRGAAGPHRFPGALERAFLDHRYEDAARLATDRGDAASAARGHFLSGDLHKAAAAFAAARKRDPERAPSWDELDSHIVVHDWARAAGVADRLRAALPDGTGEGLSCVAEVLRLKADPSTPMPEDVRTAGTAPWLCDLAFADVSDTPRTRMRLETLVATRHFGFLRPGPPPRPRGHDADVRVAAHLLAQRGQVDDFPFSLPHGAHVLLCEGPMFRMPVPALATWIAAGGEDVKPEARLEHLLLSAAWQSFLGDHQAAAEAYSEALPLAGIPEATPKIQPAEDRYFVAPAILPLFGSDSVRAPPAAAALAIGAALALRAGELDAASAAASVIATGDDPTEVGRFVQAATGHDDEALTHLQGHLAPGKRAFLEAGVKDDLALLAALERYDGQGLWPVVGRRLHRTTEPLRAWVAGGGPSACDQPSRPQGCGYYGLLGHWAARRGAAPSAMAWVGGGQAAARLRRMQSVLSDRQTAVLLYVTGRLASPDPDD